jgi:hypothetical protein
LIYGKARDFAETPMAASALAIQPIDRFIPRRTL